MAINDKNLYLEKILIKTAMVLMKNLNVVVMIFISVFMCISTYGIIYEGNAKEFLMQASYMPLAPWKIPTVICLCMLLLIVLINIKKEKEKTILICAIIELLLAIGMIYITNFTYKGLILLTFADYMKYTIKTKHIYFILVISFIIYLFADYDLLSRQLRLISFSSYISYYNNFTREILLRIKSICNGINSILFIVYMIFLMHNQSVKNRYMRKLNNELNNVNERLKAANIQLEENAKTIANMTKTEERNRLAREIHDTLGHVLTGVITGIDACIELISIAPEATKKQLEIIANVARQGMTDVRRSVKALRPDALEKMSVQKAIAKMIDEIILSTGIKINYNNSVDLANLNDDEENIIYRIIQESITNAIRHGKADEIDISIEILNGVIIISISDNGIGCDNITAGFGLLHMKERLEMLNGKLSYDGNNGFKLVAKLPKRLS